MDGHSGIEIGNGVRLTIKDKGMDLAARTPADAGSTSNLLKQGGKPKGEMDGMNGERMFDCVNGANGAEAEEGQGGWQTVRPRSGKLAAASTKASSAGSTVSAGGADQRDKKTGQVAKKAAGVNNGVLEKEPAAAEAATRGSSRREETNRTEDANQVSKANGNEDGPEYDREKTVVLELQGQDQIPALELMRCVRGLCGGIIACRATGPKSFEVTMSHRKGKERLLDGFKIRDTVVQAKGLCNDELVVSFLNLPAYITDEEILKRLDSWGVTAASPIRRRMWSGTRIADGTRFVKVKFTEKVQSLPYSAKFETAIGPEYFRVIHDRQVRVCRMCLQPGHILRDCPEFSCHKCGVQGHYARECAAAKASREEKKCGVCYNAMSECICNESEEDEASERGEMELGGSEDGDLDEAELEAESGSGAAQARAAVGVMPEPALRTKAAVGVRPEPAEKTRAAVGVRPEPAWVDEAAVGVRPEPVDTRAGSGNSGLVPSIFTVPESPLPPRAGRSRAESPALAGPEAGLGDEAEEEEKMEEEDDEPLPAAQVARKELKRAGGSQGGVPDTPEAEGGALDSSGAEMDMNQVLKVRKSLRRSRKKGKTN